VRPRPSQPPEPDEPGEQPRMTRVGRRPSLTDSQRQARRELRQIAAEYPQHLKIIKDAGLDERKNLQIVVRLTTSSLLTVPEGLPVSGDHEDVVVHIPQAFPWLLPTAAVTHDRFLRQPHVLLGSYLCIYLDADREWHPSHGMRDFLTRLWQWFADAAAGKFDATTALFHPVGGVIQRTPNTPTVVVRKNLDTNGKTFLRASLTFRTTDRVDVIDWNTRGGTVELAQVVVLGDSLPYGVGATLPIVLQQIAANVCTNTDSIATIFAHTAARNAPEAPLYVILAVPNPARVSRHHLLVVRISSAVADVLRTATTRGGPLLRINSTAIPADTPIEWCIVSDERSEITTRRDSSRPTAQFASKVVEIWGCGGLGSWIAEFIARTGVTRMVLRDPGEVQGGLLVRQNYVETDIGRNKALRLADRLREISDDLTVEAHSVGVLGSLNGALPACDVIIDATVTNSVGVYFDLVAGRAQGACRPLLAQVATDIRTATLGMLTVSAPGCPASPATIDHNVGVIALGDGRLERFHGLWQEPSAGDELIPAHGCSVPTFHGSAADVAAVAASLVSLLGPHLNTNVSGTHLVALPHAPGTGPSHHFLPVTDSW